MAHRLAGSTGLHRRVWPQVAAADAGVGDSDHGVGGLDQVGVRNGFDTNVAGAVHDGCAHLELPLVSYGLGVALRPSDVTAPRLLALGQCAVKPPSTGSGTPITKLAPGLQSQSTAAAISSERPSRPIG